MRECTLLNCTTEIHHQMIPIFIRPFFHTRLYKENAVTDTLLRQNDRLKDAYGMAKALPLLPPCDWDVGICVIEAATAGQNVQFDRFCNYLRRTWFPSKYFLLYSITPTTTYVNNLIQ